MIANRTQPSLNHLNPKLWYDADNMPLADGASIVSVPDASGNKFIGNPSSAPRRPTFRKSVTLLNKKSGIDLGASAGFISGCSLTNPFTIAFVETAEAGIGSLSRTIGAIDANTLILLGGRADSIACYNNGQISAFSLGVSGAAIGILTVGPTAAYYINGIDHTTTNTYNGDWGNLAVGIDNIFSEPGNTVVGAVMAFNRVLSLADRNILQRSWGKKYGITVP